MYYPNLDCVKQKERRLALGLTGPTRNGVRVPDSGVWIPETRSRQRFLAQRTSSSGESMGALSPGGEVRTSYSDTQKLQYMCNCVEARDDTEEYIS